MPKGPADFLLRVLQRVLGAPHAKGVKDALFDPVTSLPTLPVLLPYIRGILAERKGVGLLAVDITNVSKLEEVYGCESFVEIIPGNGAGRHSHDWPLDLPAVDRREGTSGAAVCLFLHGGPGMPSMYLAHAFQRPLEEDFIVVHWDRRGAGKSFGSGISKDSIRVSQELSDTAELVEALRQRFRQQKVWLVGHSYGSYLGILAARRFPERLFGYVGIGQVAASPEREHEVQDFFTGRHDYTDPFELTEAYFAKLRAPRKELVWFEDSAHFPFLEEPERFAGEMRRLKHANASFVARSEMH